MVKTIAKDGEVTISYNRLHEGLSRAHRKAIQQAYYDFACTCIACKPADATDGIASEMRRRLILSLSSWLKGNPTLNTAVFDRMTPQNADHPSILFETIRKLKIKLPPWKETLYTFLLAKLKESEGLIDEELAIMYYRAAESLRKN